MLELLLLVKGMLLAPLLLLLLLLLALVLWAVSPIHPLGLGMLPVNGSCPDALVVLLGIGSAVAVAAVAAFAHLAAVAVAEAVATFGGYPAVALAEAVTIVAVVADADGLW